MMLEGKGRVSKASVRFPLDVAYDSEFPFKRARARYSIIQTVSCVRLLSQAKFC